MDTRDVLALAGLLLLSIGLYHVFEPAALIAPGAILTWIAFRA